MIVVVASIHHSGTNFVLQDLLRAFTNHPNTIGSEPPEWSKVHVHLEPEQLHTVDHWMNRYPTLVPLRHPRSVALSWKKRGKSFGRMILQWRMLLKYVDHFQPNYLPLDADNRDEWLDLFCSKHSIELSTEWDVVRGSGVVIIDPDAELSVIELSEIDSLMLSPFFEQFYPRNDNVLRIDARSSAQTRATAAPSG